MISLCKFARRVVTIDRIGMVNIVAGRMIAPEFVQDAVIPARMADALLPLLDVGSAERARAVAGLDEVRRMLGTPGAAARVAELASTMARA